MKRDPSEFNGIIRSYATGRTRDVAPGKVPVQWLDEDGSVWHESDVDARLLDSLRPIARREGFTLDQMLGRVVWEGLQTEMDRRGVAGEPEQPGPS